MHVIYNNALLFPFPTQLSSANMVGFWWLHSTDRSEGCTALKAFLMKHSPMYVPISMHAYIVFSQFFHFHIFKFCELQHSWFKYLIWLFNCQVLFSFSFFTILHFLSVFSYDSCLHLSLCSIYCQLFSSQLQKLSITIQLWMMNCSYSNLFVKSTFTFPTSNLCLTVQISKL